MNCREAISFLADYLDGTLPPEVTARFNLHLANCRSCTAYLATYRETIRMARTAFNERECDVPEELIEAILASLK